jgi:serine/threonine protein kinase
MHERGMVHRDLKLENCFVNKEVIIKVADFGTCAYFTGPKSYPLTSHVGSTPYMPPEVQNNAQKKEYRGPPMDVFALGVILFFMHTGFWPF